MTEATRRTAPYPYRGRGRLDILTPSAPIARATDTTPHNPDREGTTMRNTRRAAEDPNIRDVPAFASSLTDKQLHCRELGHEWRHHTATWDPKARVFDRALRCRNCGSVRRQVLDRRGHVIRNGYNYAEGYLATKVMNRDGLGRDAFRLEALTRILETANRKAG